MKKKLVGIGIVIALLLSAYGYVHWDYYVSQYRFDRYCETLPGTVVYERVRLGDEYIRTPPALGSPDWDSRLLLSATRFINLARFEEDYLFEPFAESPLSDIGPVTLIESTVTRKADGRLLSKATSVRNYRGKYMVWASGSSPSDVNCPSSARTSGLEVSEFSKLHGELFRETFF